VERTRTVNDHHDKWCKGAVWVTFPPKGYKCLNTKFTGCNCRRYFTR